MREIETGTLARYGFVTDLKTFTLKNVCRIIGDMLCWHYFSRSNNLAFHGLTKNESFLLVAKDTLGLSNKFIPTKPCTPSASELENPQYNFRRDAHLKLFSRIN